MCNKCCIKSEGMLRLLSLRQDWYLTDQVLVSHSWEDPILGLTRGQEKSGSFKHLKPMNKLRFRHISHVKRVVSDSDMNLDSTSGKKTKALGMVRHFSLSSKILFSPAASQFLPSQAYSHPNLWISPYFTIISRVSSEQAERSYQTHGGTQNIKLLIQQMVIWRRIIPEYRMVIKRPSVGWLAWLQDWGAGTPREGLKWI